MAGSLTFRRYTGDNNVAYSAKVDESNSNAAPTGPGGSALMPIRTANNPPLPRGLKMRYVNTYSQANPNIKRRFYVGDILLIPLVLVPGATITGEDYPGAGDTAGTNATWVITSYRGEKSPNVPAFGAPDTGLTDGTVAQ